MKPHPWLLLVIVGATIGLVFAGVSTYDFVQHLDRQVHSLHCSFIPGMGHENGASGCQAALMSTYSSVFRGKVWGGVPIALPAMSVFAFILLAAIDLVITRRKDDVKATLFLLAATGLPLLMSLVMFTISLTKLGSLCKLCACVYIASILCFVGALMSHLRARRPLAATGAAQLVPVDSTGVTNGRLAAAFGIGVAFVVIPVALYFALAPDHSKFIGTCDQLVKPDDQYNVMVHVTNDKPDVDAAPAIEVLDPLCPACKAFEERLEKSGLAGRLDRKAVMFPLDSTCNWMVTESTHPGACTISEAVLCAGAKAADVIAWAFVVQDRVREESAKDPAAAARIVKERFPELASCVGSAEAKSKLNKSLRWSVANNVRITTPQLYVRGSKLCDEDVDLGLEFALPRLIDRKVTK